MYYILKLRLAKTASTIISYTISAFSRSNISHKISHRLSKKYIIAAAPHKKGPNGSIRSIRPEYR